MDRVRVGLVGLYGIANRHYDEIAATPELELGAVCDIDDTLASAWSEQYEVPWYHDYEDMFRSKDCDMAIISAPHYLHCEMACAAMEAGMPVVIQKPMCVTVAEADRIIETAQRTGTKVGTYHTAHTSELDAIAAIRTGTIGDIMRVSYSWHASRGLAYYRSGPWRGTWAGEGSGVLSNQCIHDINRLQALAGPVVEVRSCTLANIGHPGIEVEDACIAALRFTNGAFGLFHVTLYTQPSLAAYEIVGNLGCVIKDGQEKRLGLFSIPLREYLENPASVRRPRASLQDATRPEVSWQPVPDVAPAMPATLQFALSVAEDRLVQAPPEFALRDIEAWNAMVLSHFKHKAVQIPVDRDEYSALHQDLIAGRYDLHWH
jgi:UDP-N-acetyl-2-amino-2-deoxyglucuronate dehydrogenase